MDWRVRGARSSLKSYIKAPVCGASGLWGSHKTPSTHGGLEAKVRAQKKGEMEEARVRKLHTMPSGEDSAEEASGGFWAAPDRDGVGGKWRCCFPIFTYSPTSWIHAATASLSLPRTWWGHISTLLQAGWPCAIGSQIVWDRSLLQSLPSISSRPEPASQLRPRERGELLKERGKSPKE